MSSLLYLVCRLLARCCYIAVVISVVKCWSLLEIGYTVATRGRGEVGPIRVTLYKGSDQHMAAP